MIRIGRHIEGITINPLEYLLDDNGKIMLFGCEEEAKEFLSSHGITEDEMYWLIFEECTICDSCNEVVPVGDFNECCICNGELTFIENF